MDTGTAGTSYTKGPKSCTHYPNSRIPLGGAFPVPTGGLWGGMNASVAARSGLLGALLGPKISDFAQRNDNVTMRS